MGRSSSVIRRMYGILNAAPKVGFGMSTADMAGYISKARDLAFIVGLAVEALEAASYADAPKEAIEEPLEDAEAYIRRRNAEDWNFAGAGKGE